MNPKETYWTGMSDGENWQFPTVLTVREAYLICGYLRVVVIATAGAGIAAFTLTDGWGLRLGAPAAVIAVGALGLWGWVKHRIRSGEDARRRNLIAEGKADMLVPRGRAER